MARHEEGQAPSMGPGGLGLKTNENFAIVKDEGFLRADFGC